MNFFDDLKRRNVPKASLAYLVIAWVLIQVFSLLLPMINAPEWVLKTLTLIFAIGFPVWVAFSWTYEITPEGIKKTKEVSEDNSITGITNKRLNVLILIALVIAITVGLMSRPISNDDSELASDTTILDKSIAVLPFDDMSSGGDTQWFCDGMTEDILTKLSQIKELKVISRTSTERYKKTDKSIPEIAKELGVAYILEGSVRKHENKVIITAQLIDANDRHMWADNFNDNFEEVFEIQNKVSRKVVDQLHIILNPEDEKALRNYPTTNMKAYELLLKARSFADKRTKEDYLMALELYQKAIDLDVNFAEAYAEMALCYLFNFFLDNSNADKNYEKARSLINKSLSIEPNLAKGYTANGIINWYDNKKRDAKINFEKAIELNPNDAIAYQNMAIYYMYDDFNKSLFYINKAIKLDPFSAMVTGVKINILTESIKIEEAEALYNSKSHLFSDNIKEAKKNRILQAKAISIGLENKDRTETIRFYEKAIEKEPENAALYRLLGIAYDCILNDNESFIKYTKKAFELDSTNVLYARTYNTALVEGSKFKESMEFFNTDNYKNITNEIDVKQGKVYHYYHQGDYISAKEILKDTTMIFADYYRALLMARTGELKELRLLLNKEDALDNLRKAYVFAILKNRDSMYYYVNKVEGNDRIDFNSRSEFDPYRKEERFKEYLRQNYLPITHWNE